MDIYKQKLPAGWSYALKPSRLESAVAAARILFPVSLHQSQKTWELNAPALSATFYPIGSYLGGELGRISVSSYAIPSEQRSVQQAYAETVFLPELIDWIRSIEMLPLDSTIRREKQDFSSEGSPLAVSKRPLPLENKGQPRRKK